MPPAGAAVVRAPRVASRRERRKAETRARLLAAARELFVARGYDATRPQDISRLADVATGTFYLHFADKREAFQAFTDQAAHELMERLRARREGGADFERGLLHALEALCEYADANPGVLRAAFADEAVIAAEGPRDSGLRARLAATLAESLREGMARGELFDDCDATIVAWGIVGLVEQALSFGAREHVARDRLLENLTRFCGRALVRGKMR